MTCFISSGNTEDFSLIHGVLELPKSVFGWHILFCSFCYIFDGLILRESIKFSSFFKKKNFFCLFLYYGCAGSSLLCRLFSNCGRGAAFPCIAWASLLGGFSCCGALGQVSFSSVALRCSCPLARGIFPCQGSNLCLLH